MNPMHKIELSRLRFYTNSVKDIGDLFFTSMKLICSRPFDFCGEIDVSFVMMVLYYPRFKTGLPFCWMVFC